MRRVRRWLPMVALMALLGFGLEVGLASGSEAAVAGEPYREGPLDRPDPPSSVDWPNNAEEFLAIGVLAAILYGFRASGLAQNSAPARSKATGAAARISRPRETGGSRMG